MSQKNQTVAEAVEQLFPTQTTSLVAPDPEDAKGVADWYQQVTAEVKAGKIRISDTKRFNATHGLIFAVVVERL